jgi:hypothetical protein
MIHVQYDQFVRLIISIGVGVDSPQLRRNTELSRHYTICNHSSINYHLSVRHNAVEAGQREP